MVWLGSIECPWQKYVGGGVCILISDCIVIYLSYLKYNIEICWISISTVLYNNVISYLYIQILSDVYRQPIIVMIEYDILYDTHTYPILQIYK